MQFGNGGFIMPNEEKVLNLINKQNILKIISNRYGFSDLFYILGSFTKTVIYAMATGIITAGTKWSLEEIALICDLSIEDVSNQLSEAEMIMKNCWYQAKYLGISENNLAR